MTPPPLPDSRPIRFATFYGKQAGLIGSNLSTAMLHQAQQDAATWMNANPGIEIVTLKTLLTDHLAAVTVWFRDQPAGN